ncbi:MAG TPA: MDR family MFS transporter [Roseiflexaceae bacterium]|nr:MDR family MFS transporter [Roseiflexaceae bacterium]
MVAEHTAELHEQQTSRRDMGIIFTMLVATFVVILNETIMNVALPKLMVELRIEASTVQWLTTIYMLVMAVLIPTTGFLMQRFTTRALFLSAMSVFTAGSLVAGFAPGFEVLLLGRILQASGTALMLPLLTTTILALIPVHRRGAMMGTVSIVISVAPAIGPTISGLIIQSLSWRFLFFFIVPITLGVLLYGARNLVNIGERRHTTLDLPSVLLSALGFGGLVYGLSSAGEGGGAGGSTVVAALVISLICLAVFVWRQLTLSTPLLDLRVFRYPMFRLSVGLIMLVMMALFASALLLPIYLQTIRQFSPLQTGLMLLPGGVLMGLASPVVGRIFDRYGPRALVSVGGSLLVAVLASYTTLTPETPVPMLLALHICFNSGLALLFTPIFATGLNQLPRSLYPHGSAVSSTLQQVAGAIGTALLVTVMTASARAHEASEAPIAALNAGLHSAFTVAAGIAVLALTLTLFIRRSSPPDEPSAEQPQPSYSAH